MRHITLLIFFIITLFVATPTFAELNVYIEDTDLKITNTTRSYVHFSWKVDVFSHEYETRNCILKISFIDSEGFELDSVAKLVTLPYGSSSFTNRSLCRIVLWEQIKKHITSFECR